MFHHKGNKIFGNESASTATLWLSTLHTELLLLILLLIVMIIISTTQRPIRGLFRMCAALASCCTLEMVSKLYFTADKSTPTWQHKTRQTLQRIVVNLV